MRRQGAGGLAGALLPCVPPRPLLMCVHTEAGFKRLHLVSVRPASPAPLFPVVPCLHGGGGEGARV